MPNNNQVKPSKNLGFRFFWPYILAIAIIIATVVFTTLGTSRYNVEFTDFTSMQSVLDEDNFNVTKINVTERETVIDISGSYVGPDIKNVTKTATYSFSLRVPVVEFDTTQTENVYTKAEIYDYLYTFKDSNNLPILQINNAYQATFWDYLVNLLPMIGLVVVALFFFSRLGRVQGGNDRAFDFGKTPMKAVRASNVRFKDVAGCEEEKNEMAEIVEYLKNPKKFTDMGARVPKGIILTGAPGTGKTLLAKAVAGEAQVPFFFLSGSDFVEMFVGVGASRVRDMFAQAKKNRPCIIFIDEIDAVGRQRGTGLGGGHDEREQTLNQLLVEMDGFEDNSGIIVIAATNRSDILDPALLRPGRFDRQIIVDLPDRKGREEILKVHARNKKFAGDVNFDNVAGRTPGFSGADLENVLNEAAILAVRQHSQFITMADIDEAIDRVMSGPAKKSRKVSQKERTLVAYHEAGHAIVGLVLKQAMKVQKVTIIPRGEAGGYVLMTPDEENYLATATQLKERISGLLGGRVSEEIFFNDVTSGAQNDIEKATKIARLMVTNYGMSSLGPIQYEQPQGNVFLGRDYTNASRNVSGEIAFEIDKEMQKIINECMDKTRAIIMENKDKVILIAEKLLELDTLTYEQINELLNPTPINTEVNNG